MILKHCLQDWLPEVIAAMVAILSTRDFDIEIRCEATRTLQEVLNPSCVDNVGVPTYGLLLNEALIPYVDFGYSSQHSKQPGEGHA